MICDDFNHFYFRPITYLYNTLFYYELKLRDRPALKRLLVGAIVTSLKDVREKNWALTEQYQLYIKNQLSPEDPTNAISQIVGKWSPDLTYYMGIVKRLIESKFPLSRCRKNFSNLSIFQQLKAKTFSPRLTGDSMNFRIPRLMHFTSVALSFLGCLRLQLPSRIQLSMWLLKDSLLFLINTFTVG